MAKAKKTKPRDRLVRWRVSLITKTPAGFVDFAYAPDAQAAERQVAREHKISGTLRNRLDRHYFSIDSGVAIWFCRRLPSPRIEVPPEA